MATFCRDFAKVRTHMMLLGILVLIFTSVAHAQSVAGDWKGTLQAPNGSLPLIFHLDGNGGGMVDSPAQNFSAPLQYQANANQLTISVPSVQGKYSGTINGNHADGAWSQNGGTLPLALTKSDAGNGESSGGASDSHDAITLQGDWGGTLKTPNGDLPLVFHLDGNGGGTVDSPAQNFSAPIQYSSSGSSVTILVQSVQGRYSGNVTGEHMAGSWSQNGATLPLALNKQ